MIQSCYGITSGRVLNGLCTKITKVDSSAFAYRLFHEEHYILLRGLKRNLHETASKQMQINQLLIKPISGALSTVQ